MRKFRDVIKETRMVAIMNPLSRNTTSAYMSVKDEPCCIFGHVLKRLSLTLDGLDQNMFSVPDLPWEDWGFEKPNDYQSLWTVEVQSAADNGDVWIVAVATADAKPI